jgi:hypothetical protein
MFNRITRDNASSNDTLISTLKQYYLRESVKFQGDIACLAHVLNLVVQDILKALIKDAYNDINDNDIYQQENNQEEEYKGKFLILYLIFIIIYTNNYFRYISLEKSKKNNYRNSIFTRK